MKGTRHTTVPVTVLAVACMALASPAHGQDDRQHPTLEAARAYVGEWRAEDRTAPDGRTFHFVYSLSWFDAQKNVLQMVIRQEFDSHESRLLWRGFKALDPSSDSVEYVAFSPGGRMARGHLETDGPRLITAYSGWNPNGQEVRIRDVFSPVEDGGFVSTTYLTRDGGEEWGVVNVDHWERLGGSAGSADPDRR